jgi:hypothetical protein
MNKKIFLISAIALSATFFFSCKTDTKETGKDSDSVASQVTEVVKTEAATTETDEYCGTYKATAETACEIAVSISKSGGAYAYTLTSAGKEYKGTAKIEKQEVETYIHFEGKIEDATKEVSGLIQGTSIMIQNSGNAMNPFELFKSCSAKYIELAKETAK